MKTAVNYTQMFIFETYTTKSRTHLQAEASIAGGWNKLIERQSEVYIERLATGCQVNYRRSIMQLISRPRSRIKWSIDFTVQYIMA